jgi:cytoskeletal protein CcmA (bactofilin family)
MKHFVLHHPRLTVLLAFLTVAAVLLAITLLSDDRGVCCGPPAGAAELKTDDKITIAAGQRVDDDLYVFGEDVVIAGEVTGDVIGAAETIEISGTVGGSVNVAVRRLEISGTVSNAVRVAAAEVIVSGDVDRDLIVTSGSVEITRSGAVAGDLLLGSGDATLAGPVGGDVRGSTADLTIASRVAGDVRVSADDITITANGRIAGDLRYASNSAVAIAEGGRVGGATERTSNFRAAGGPDLWSALTGPLARLLVGLITGLVLLVLLPRPVVAAADAIRTRFLPSLLAGIVGWIVWPILAVLLLAIVVGIPIAVIGTVLLLSLAYLSQVFAGLAIGRLVLPKGWKVSSRGYNILAMALGMILIAALRAVPLPYISAIIALIVAVIGVGGVLVATTHRPERATP